jgi:predicted histidine transporter YuiF (NhaC family)
MTSLDRQRVVRYLGAAALLGVGIDHIQQYVGAQYSVIPTIGTLFVLNFAASTVVAIALIFRSSAPGDAVGSSWAASPRLASVWQPARWPRCS